MRVHFACSRHSCWHIYSQTSSRRMLQKNFSLAVWPTRHKYNVHPALEVSIISNKLIIAYLTLTLTVSLIRFVLYKGNILRQVPFTSADRTGDYGQHLSVEPHVPQLSRWLTLILTAATVAIIESTNVQRHMRHLVCSELPLQELKCVAKAWNRVFCWHRKRT